MPPPSSPSADDTQDDSGFHSGGNYFHRRRVFVRYIILRTKMSPDNTLNNRNSILRKAICIKLYIAPKTTLEITNGDNRNFRREMPFKREI